MVRSLISLFTCCIVCGPSWGQGDVLYGKWGAYQFWCDTLRTPLILEISGPKLGVLDTLSKNGNGYVGTHGTLVFVEGRKERMRFVSPTLKLRVTLRPHVPGRREMDRRRFVFGTVRYWTLDTLRRTWSFPEFESKADAQKDFDDFINRRNGPPAYITEFYEALHRRRALKKE